MKVVQITTDSREHFGDYANPTPYFGTAPQALLQGFAMLPEAEVHVVCCVQQPVESPKKIADNIFYHSLVVPKIGRLRTGYQGCIRAVRGKLKEIQPDIVHGQGTERECAICAVFSGYPNVLTIHGNMRAISKLSSKRWSFYYKVAAWLEKFCLKRTDGVVAISSYTKCLIDNLVRKTWLLPNAVDPSFFRLSTFQAIKPRILFVGSICDYKNPTGLLEAVADLLVSHQCSIAFAGSGETEGAYYKRFVAVAATLPSVELLGFLDRERLVTEMARSSILVLPTFEDNCPMVVLEAQAAGLPVAASNVGGIPDLITHGSTGLLFDPAQPATMRECIEQLLKTRNLRDALGGGGKQHAIKTYHPAVIAKKHLEIYREVLMKNESQPLK